MAAAPTRTSAATISSACSGKAQSNGLGHERQRRADRPTTKNVPVPFSALKTKDPARQHPPTRAIILRRHGQLAAIDGRSWPDHCRAQCHGELGESIRMTSEDGMRAFAENLLFGRSSLNALPEPMSIDAPAHGEWQAFVVTAGEILERAGALLQQAGGQKPPVPAEGVPGGGYRFDHFSISGDVSRHWVNPSKLPKRREFLQSIANAALRAALQHLQDKGVLAEIEAQLARDSIRLKKRVFANVKIEIMEDDWFAGLRLGGATFGGKPITVFLNLSTLTGDFDAIKRVLIHELLHAKDTAYVDAGLPSPYPKGHEDEAFKKRESELRKMAGV